MKDFSRDNFRLNADDTIHDAIVKIDKNRHRIVFVVDRQQRLIGTITDGDIRRSLLARSDMSASLSELLSRKADTQYEKPYMAPAR